MVFIQSIEGVFHEIQNTGRNPERLLNKTVGGLATHMTAKITSHTLRLLLLGQQKSICQKTRRGRRINIMGVWEAEQRFEYALKVGTYKAQSYLRFMD